MFVVEYAHKIKRTSDDLGDPSTFAGHRKRLFIAPTDQDGEPALKRFHQMMLKCGPYWQDVEALMARLLDEGLKPTRATFMLLLLSYRDSRPPQPKKSAQALQRMWEQGLSIHASACNALVDCWCRAGNMCEAEKVVAHMENIAEAKSKWRVKSKEDELPPRWAGPNEQTYLILTDGWQRLGVMEDIGNRQRGFRYDEAREKNHRENSIAGVLGMGDPAPSLLTSLARRRFSSCSVFVVCCIISRVHDAGETDARPHSVINGCFTQGRI